MYKTNYNLVLRQNSQTLADALRIKISAFEASNYLRILHMTDIVSTEDGASSYFVISISLQPII